MGFLSLYRKYRPLVFDDLVGQEHVVRTLKNALDTGRIAHAYLFTGPRGTGKTSTAKVFARSLNCIDGPTDKPCGECEACQKILSGQSMDVIEIDAASNRGIDEIRDLREKVKFYPTEGDYKVYIIDEVHMLTKGAFNALLKTLEEPPEKVIFILATTEPNRVIETILSRCQRFDFSLFPISDIRKRLEYICNSEGANYTLEALEVIARNSNGGMRDAISLLDQAISFTGNNIDPIGVQKMLGKVDKSILIDFFTAVGSKEPAAALKIVNQLIDRGTGISIFISDLIEHAREMILIKECGIEAGILDYPLETLNRLSSEGSKIDITRLIRIIEILTRADRDINISNQPRLILEIAVVKMSSPEVDNSLEGLQARIAELEYKLQQVLTVGKIDSNKLSDKNKDSNELVKTNNINSIEPARTQKGDNEYSEYVNKVDVQESNDIIIDEATTVKDNATEKTTAVTIDQVRKAWPLILTKIKEQNIQVHAYVLEGIPVEISNNKLLIEFPTDKGFHIKMAEKNNIFVQKIISKVLDSKFELIFNLAGEDQKVNLVKDKEVDKKEKTDGVIDKVLQAFDGDVIKVNYQVLEKD